MKVSMDVCEKGIQSMQEVLEPDITENALWAKLHETNIRLGVNGSKHAYSHQDQ